MSNSRPKFKLTLTLLFDVDIMTGEEEEDEKPVEFNDASAKLEFNFQDMEEAAYGKQLPEALFQILSQSVRPINEEVKNRMKKVTGSEPVVSKMIIHKPGEA